MRLHHVFLATLTAAAAAQSPACEAANDQSSATIGAITSYGFSGPNTNAWQFTPQNSGVLFGGQLFTGNTALSGDRYMTLEIWSDVAGAPGARLAGGTWKISAGLGIEWQGTNFETAVPVTSGVPIWVVWIDPGFSEIPEEPGGGVQMLKATFNGAWNVPGATAALKVRLYCNFLDNRSARVFGAPCASTTGTLGTTFANHLSRVGNADFAVEGTGFPSGSLAILGLGLDPNWVAVAIPGLPAGCMQNTEMLATSVSFTGTGNVRGPTAANHVNFPLPIPNNANLAGLILSAQVIVADPGSLDPLPFIGGNAMRFAIQ